MYYYDMLAVLLDNNFVCLNLAIIITVCNWLVQTCGLFSVSVSGPYGPLNVFIACLYGLLSVSVVGSHDLLSVFITVQY